MTTEITKFVYMTDCPSEGIFAQRRSDLVYRLEIYYQMHVNTSAKIWKDILLHGGRRTQKYVF